MDCMQKREKRLIVGALLFWFVLAKTVSLALITDMMLFVDVADYRTMRLLHLVVLAMVAMMNAEAFTATKKREPTRPAFKSAVAGTASVASNVEQHEQQHQAPPTNREDPPVFAFKGQAMVPVQVEVVHADDDFEIGYTTGLVACVVSLALGFGLGYGTL